MTRWAALVAAVLWCCSLGTCEKAVKNITIPQSQFNSSHSLCQLIVDFIQDNSSNDCAAHILNGGFISLKNETRNTSEIYTVGNPGLFVTCKEKAGSIPGQSAVLKDFANKIASLEVIDDSKDFLGKDDFRDSILMIAFSSCAICVGTWMIYMVLLFQRCPRHGGRRALMLFYVLFAAIYESISLNRAVQKIFKKQFNGNYQDSSEYVSIITNSNAHRAQEVVIDFLACLNWISIIYYMFHDCKRINKRWLPRVVANRNRLIIVVGLCLTAIDEAVFGVLMWSCWSNGLRIVHFIFDMITYALFCGFTCYFVYHDFGFILSPKKPNADQRDRAKQAWKILWRDYHKTLPLLVFNLAVSGLLFGTRIYFFINLNSKTAWKYNVIKLFKVVITVSVWGLIAVLEKRELIVSRETVLGRKIQNSDRFFYDPELITVKSGEQYSRDSIDFQTSKTSDSDQEQKTTVESSPWALLKFKLPTKAWQSQLRNARKRRMRIEKTQKRFLHALAGSNTRREETEQTSEAVRIVASDEEQSGVRDDTSVETELATNYIYDMHDC